MPSGTAAFHAEPVNGYRASITYMLLPGTFARVTYCSRSKNQIRIRLEKQPVTINEAACSP